MTAATVLGVDPGGRYVGLAVVTGAELLRAKVLDRRRLDDPTDRPAWVRHVLDRVADEVELAGVGRIVDVAVEDVRAPNPHVRRRDGNSLTNLDGILDTAVVVGALIAAYPAAVLIAPGGNGHLPDYGYPAGIRKGTRGLGGPPDHARSAYDVARAAAWQLRVRVAR